MPIFCPTRVQHNRTARTKLLAAELIAAALLAAAFIAAAFIASPISAQTLAHPGLADNGLNADPWWQHAVFYQLSPSPAQPQPDFKTLAAQISTLRSLGVDALLVPTPPKPTQLPAAPPEAAPSPDPALEDFDELLHQASRSGIRVLLTFTPASVTADPSPLARFWLSRGVAGFHLVTPAGAAPPDIQTFLQALRRATASAVGQRIVLSDYDPSLATPATTVPRSRNSRRTAAQTPTLSPQLQVDSRLVHIELPEAAALRTLITQSLTQPNLLLDLHAPAPAAGSPDPYPALAHALAVLALTLHPANLIDSTAAQLPPPPPPPTQEEPTPKPPAPTALPGITFTIPQPNQPHKPAPPPPAANTLSPEALQLLDWHRQLVSLHRNNAALRFGTPIPLNFDAQNALVWVARPATNSALNAPVVIACNLTSSPITLAIGPALKALNLRGTYLRTLLRSDRSMGPQDIDAVILPPFAVYLGELHR